MKGVCIEAAGSANLRVGEKYYLFPHGQNHFYASRFNHKGSHYGAYEKNLFEVIHESKEDWPPEPSICKMISLLNRSKVYKAELIWRMRGYKETPLGTYYIKPKKTHCYFYFDPKMQKPGGCFPLHWFNNFEEHDPDVEEVKELPKNEWEQLALF